MLPDVKVPSEDAPEDVDSPLKEEIVDGGIEMKMLVDPPPTDIDGLARFAGTDKPEAK